MNPPDFRSFCAELIRLTDEPLGDYSSWHHRWHTACAETRAALAQPMELGRPGHCVSTRQLMAAWGVAQCSVSRRLAAINRASLALSALGDHADGAQIGRIVRVHRAPGWWRVVGSAAGRP
jgi:hypothetical protein